MRCEVGRQSQGESRLADTARARQCQQFHVFALQQRTKLRELGFPSHERARVGGKREPRWARRLVRAVVRGAREEGFAHHECQVVGDETFEFIWVREALVRDLVTGADAVEHLVQPRFARWCRSFDVDELRLRAAEQVFVLETGHVHAGSDPAVALPVDRHEDVTLIEIRAIQVARRVRSRAELEEDGGKVEVFDRATHAGALGRKLLHRGGHEHTYSLIRREDCPLHPSHCGRPGFDEVNAVGADLTASG